MNVKSCAWRSFLLVGGVVALASVCPSGVVAQSGGQASSMQPHLPSSDSALVRIVQESTKRFHDVAAAEAEGYHLMFGCVSGPDRGAMGLHFVNMAFVADGELDPTRPEIILYEPTPNGRLRLTGADFLLLADAWDRKGVGTPQLMGQLLHFFESPNRFGLPPFYTLHVWAWKESPTGTFVNWHAGISCDGFSPERR